MERLRPWLAAARPEHALIVPLCVEVGAACAHFDARPDAGILAHVLIDAAALAAGLGVQLADHAWDRLGDPPSSARTAPPESERPVASREAAVAAAACLILAALLTLGLSPAAGAAPLGFGAVAVGLGLWRRAPLAGGDTLGFGLGDFATVLALGPFAVLAGFAAQTGTGSWGAALAGVPVGLAAESAQYLRHFTRLASDAGLERMTPVALLGEDRARMLVPAIPLAAALALELARRGGEYPGSAWIACAPLVAIAIAAGWRLRGDPAAADDDAVERIALPGVAVSLIALIATLRLAG